MNWQNVLDQYINAHRLAWAESTLRSENFRLCKVLPYLDKGPDYVWGMIQLRIKAYSRLTLWTRLVNMLEWAIEEGLVEGPNKFKKFRKKNRRLFNHVYIRRPAEITYEEAYRRIERINNVQCAAKAKELICTGLRFAESFNVQGGEVTGKGGKIRRVFARSADRDNTIQVTYSQFYRALKQVGLKPHTLRKVFLSRAVEKGATHFELCKLAGWASINTASSYINTTDKRLEQLVRQVNA